MITEKVAEFNKSVKKEKIVNFQGLFFPSLYDESFSINFYSDAALFCNDYLSSHIAFIILLRD